MLPASAHHLARYLVLIGSTESAAAPPVRAVLFDSEQHYLSELVDCDEGSLSRLLRAAERCTLPAAAMLEQIPRRAPQAPADDLQCFRLQWFEAAA